MSGNALDRCINPSLAREIRRAHSRHRDGFIVSSAETFVETSVVSGAELKRLQRVCVYALWRGDECLYVGMSGRGAARPFDPKHENIGVILEPKDELLILWFNGLTLAAEIEYWLIYLLRPRLNKQPQQWRMDRIGLLSWYAKASDERLRSWKSIRG